MHAAAVDRIVVRSHHKGKAGRDGEVVEVRGADGTPPHLVRWSDDGHQSLRYPSSDADVTTYEAV